MEDVVDLAPVALVNIMNMYVNVCPMFNQPLPQDHQPPPLNQLRAVVLAAPHPNQHNPTPPPFQTVLFHPMKASVQRASAPTVFIAA